MPLVHTSGVPIHYEVEGDASLPPLLLIHGWTSDLESWRDFGYVAALRERFRLILMDARGHGGSGAPESADAYGPESFVADTRAVLEAAGVSAVTLWGYSMGAAVGFQLAADAPHGVKRLIAGGMHPYARSPAGSPLKSPGASMTALLRERGMPGFVAERERGLGGRLVSPLRDRLLAANPIALAASGEAWAGWRGVGDRLDAIGMPVVLYAGGSDREFHDGARRAARELRNARFESLPGMSHDAAFASSRTVLTALGRHLGP